MRFSEKEAKMYAIGQMSFGLPLNANFFRSYFKGVTDARATELEKIQEDMTSEEARAIIKACK